MLADLIDRFLASCRPALPSLHDWRMRRCHLELFRKLLTPLGATAPAHLTPQLLQRFQTALLLRPTRFGRPPSAAFQVAVLASVRHFLAYLVGEGHLLFDPSSALQNPRREDRLPARILTRREAERLLRAPDPNSLLGCRDRALLETLYATGLRSAELLGLEVSDLLADGPACHVRNGKGGKDRFVPLGGPAFHALSLYLQTARPRLARLAHPPTAVLFLSLRGRPLTNEILNDLLARYSQKAAIGRRITAHAFRHACATLMLKAGCDIRYLQALLGHSSLNSTQLYTRVEISDLARVHARFHPRSFGRAHRRPR